MSVLSEAPPPHAALWGAAPAPSTNLQRGRACMDCRRRKMKCDGVRPVCGQCTRYGRPDDCEYVNDQGRCQSQILEEHISFLEARVHELENPHDSSSIKLYNPYAAPTPRAQSVPLPSPSPVLTPNEPEPAGDWRMYQSPPPLPEDAWWDAASMPSHIVQPLLDKFLPYASECGLFLHPARLRASALLPASAPPHARPAPALLAALCLWGVRLFASPALAALEDAVLARTLALAAAALAGDHPRRLAHAVQTEVLLCSYFFAAGRLLQGKYHVALAVSHVHLGDLCRLRSRSGADADPVEAGELVRAFWAVLVMDKAWAVALDAPSILLPSHDNADRAVDTPWPLDADAYEQGPPPPTRSADTIRAFLRGDDDAHAPSLLATHAQAALLLDRAHFLAKDWAPGMPAARAHAFFAACGALNALIARFVSRLPAAAGGEDAARARARVVAHCLAHLAAIRLNARFARASEAARGVCLDAARAVVALTATLDRHDFACINPVMGSVWTAVCQIYIDEIAAQRVFAASVHGGAADGAEEQLFHTLQGLLSTMAAFALNSPLLKYQLSKVQEAAAVM